MQLPVLLFNVASPELGCPAADAIRSFVNFPVQNLDAEWDRGRLFPSANAIVNAMLQSQCGRHAIVLDAQCTPKSPKAVDFAIIQAYLDARVCDVMYLGHFVCGGGCRRVTPDGSILSLNQSTHSLLSHACVISLPYAIRMRDEGLGLGDAEHSTAFHRQLFLPRRRHPNSLISLAAHLFGWEGVCDTGMKFALMRY